MLEDSAEQLSGQNLSPKKIKLVTVSEVSRRGQSAVVEWYEEDLPNRKIVPVQKLTQVEGTRAYTILDKDLEKCPDYGIAWAKLLPELPSLEELEKILKQRGIWTAEDFGKKQTAYTGALQQFHNKGAMAILKSREVK